MWCTQKVLGVGGPYKLATYACHFCMETKDEIGIPNGCICDRICQEIHNDNDNWECTHRRVLSKIHMESVDNTLTTLNEALGDLVLCLKTLHSETSVCCTEDHRGCTKAKSRHDIRSIHFDVGPNSKNSKMDIDTYFTNITLDLLIRGLDISGDILEWQERLHQALIKEWTYMKLLSCAEYNDANKAKRVLDLLDCVPCILHMENRVGLKILQLLLNDGLNNAGKKKIFVFENNKKKLLSMLLKKSKRLLTKRYLEMKNTLHDGMYHIMQVAVKSVT
jgi:hypothetical protein